MSQRFNFAIASVTFNVSQFALKLGLDYSKVLYYDKAQGRFLEYSADKKEFTSLSPGVAYYLYSPADTSWALQFPVSSTSFLYDGDGGRVRKTTDDGRGTTASVTYVGALFEIDSSGKTTKHIFAGANRVCTITKDDGRGTKDVSYYHSDHLGSSSVITDESGNQVEHYEYTPYGTTAVSEIVPHPSSLIHHKFTGKELDSTGLYFYGARYYDPEIGRFITADTIVQAPYDPQSLNRYSYCRNNPINYVDPTGHVWWLIALAFIAKAAAVVSIGTAIAGGISLAAGNQSLANTFFQISQISGYVSAAAGAATFMGSLMEAGKSRAVNVSSLISSFDETTPNIDLGTIVVRPPAKMAASVAWEASKGAVGASIAGAAAAMGSQITQAASFIIDTATISGGTALIQGANYGTVRGWLESSVGFIGVAAATVDAGLGVASFGAKGVVGQGVKRIVIGEGSERVAAKALAIGAEHYVPRKTVQEIGIKKTMRNNYQWLKRKVEQGYEIIDEGLDRNPERTTRGIFYEAEKRWLKIWGK